jgi:hypothetical protein
MRARGIVCVLLAVCLIPKFGQAVAQDSNATSAGGGAPISLDGHWIAEQDDDFVLDVDGGTVGGHYWCRHTFLSIRGEISADGDVDAWAAEAGVPSYKARITGKLPTLTIVFQDLCPGERTMHKK